MGPHDILLSDVGAHKNVDCPALPVPRAKYLPHSEWLLLDGIRTAPARSPPASCIPIVRVLAIAGDAGFLMNVQEMETAVRIGSNIVVLVWADNEYGLIAWKQETHFGKHTELSFGNPDWEQLASAFAWNGHYVSRSDELAGTLESAFQGKWSRASSSFPSITGKIHC